MNELLVNSIARSASGSDAAPPVAPAVIRGCVIDTNLMEFGGRNGDLKFLAPAPAAIVEALPLGNPAKMADLYALSMDEILEYLQALGQALRLEVNAHMRQALELSYLTAPTTPPIMRNQYEKICALFSRSALDEIIASVGRDYLVGWVESRQSDGRTRSVRAFGARTLHIVAGNSPTLSAVTIIRNAITRSDAIIKAPSNDPFTAIAIARTMLEMAPDHPLSKHVSAAYWKGGDEAFERVLYQPHNIEKIVAWGGFASVKHVTRYIQPGLELISLDPKRSISIVGAEAFANDDTLDEAALRVATDVGALNQETCASARVVYVLSGSDEAGVERLQRLGQRVYDKLLTLPDRMSTAPKSGIDQELKRHIDASAMNDDWYDVIGGDDEEGAVIVSKLPEPVDFATILNNRVANLVPVDNMDDILRRMDAYCQTVGVYPDSAIPAIRDRLSLSGAQRIMSLGYALSGSFGGPQDGLEPLRRMCKWILQETCDPQTVPPLWQ